MFDFIPDEILNAFAIRAKLADLQRKADNPRTPKKYRDPIAKEIARYELLLKEREQQERRGRRRLTT